MRTRHGWGLFSWCVAFGLAVAGAGCHAAPDDAVGQAKELSDSVRRANAIVNLTTIYTKALAQNGGNRQAAAVKSVADAAVQPLVDTFIQHPEDNQARGNILNLLGEMRDPRSMPALLEALKWRAEVNEEHAISAARTLASLEIPADKKADVVTRIGEALEQVTGPRPLDNRMRIEFLRALGAISHPSAVEVLTKIVLKQSEEQNFLINRLAAEQVGKIADAAAVPAMIQALFLFDAANPAMRMNDVAAEALVRIGRPSLQPLLNALAGQDAAANQIATAYIAAVRQRAPEAAAKMSVEGIVAGEATFALGELGMREAIDALVRETQSEDAGRRLSGAIGLVRINRAEEDTTRIRDALKVVYEKADKPIRAQLLVAMQHVVDPDLMPFLLEQAKAPEDELPDIRIIAFRAYAFLANKAEAAAARAVIAAEPSPEDGGFKPALEESAPALAAAEECDQDVACWTRKLGDANPVMVRKAAYMLARYGRGNAEAITSLVQKLDHSNEEVRGDVLYALDHIAVRGSAAAVEKIEKMRQTEEGRAIWNHIKQLAIPTQARLRVRAQ